MHSAVGAGGSGRGVFSLGGNWSQWRKGEPDWERVAGSGEQVSMALGDTGGLDCLPRPLIPPHLGEL